MGKGCNLGDGQHRPYHIAGVNQYHETGAGVYSSGDIGQVKAAIRCTVGDTKNNSLFLQSAQRSHYGIVLHGTGDNAVAGLEQTFQDDVYSMSCIAGEDDSRGVTTIKEAGDIFSGVVHHPRRLNR